MNFSIYLFGTPQKYDQYPLDHNCELFRESVHGSQSHVQLRIFRESQLIYYTYSHYDLVSNIGYEGAYLGIGLVFNGVCFNDVKGIHELFENLYSQMVSKEEIIKKDRTGNVKYEIKSFIEKEEVIADCKAFLQDRIDKQFSQKGRDYIELDSSFDQTNTNTKTLSFDAENSEIISAIRKYGQVILYTPEVSIRNVIINNSGKPKRTKWISPLPVAVVIILAVLILIFSYQYKTSATVKSNEVKSTSIMSNSIVGKYSCTIDSPQYIRLGIDITYDRISRRYLGKLSNPDYLEKKVSEVFIDSERKEIHNDVLGQGYITENSFGDTVIISKPKNNKRWEMRKL